MLAIAVMLVVAVGVGLRPWDWGYVPVNGPLETRVYDLSWFALPSADSIPGDPDEFGFSSSPDGRQMHIVGGRRLTWLQFDQLEDQRRLEARIEWIRQSITPDSWRDRPGYPSITPQRGANVLISQTAENHQKIIRLLDDELSRHGVQIIIETRMLQNAKAIAYIESVGGKWIDEPGGKRFSLFLTNEKKAEADRSHLIAQGGGHGAPRMTLLDGQRGFVVVAVETAYLAEPARVEGAVSGEPVVKVLPSGMVLDFRATVSDDRKSVTLELRPRTNQLLKFDPPTPEPREGEPTTAPTFVQVPHVSMTAMDVKVRVPAGEWVVLKPTPRRSPADSDAPDPEPLIVMFKPTLLIPPPMQSTLLPQQASAAHP